MVPTTRSAPPARRRARRTPTLAPAAKPRWSSWAFYLAVLTCVAAPANAHAQPQHDVDAPQQAEAPGAAASGPPSAVLTDPHTGERYLEVRPTQPLEQGRWSAPPWLVWAVGALGVFAGATVLGRRVALARARRGR